MRSIYRGEPCLSLTHERGKSPVLLLGLRPGGRGCGQCVTEEGGGRVSFPPPLSASCSAPPPPAVLLQCGEDGRLVTHWALSTLPLSSVCHRRYERRCRLLEVQICKNIQFYDLKCISLGCTEPTPFTPHTDGTELPARSRVRLRIVIPKPK